MSDLEFIGQIKPQPYMSLRKEEELRIKAIKERLSRNKPAPQEVATEITYERDVQEDF